MYTSFVQTLPQQGEIWEAVCQNPRSTSNKYSQQVRIQRVNLVSQIIHTVSNTDQKHVFLYTFESFFNRFVYFPMN